MITYKWIESQSRQVFLITNETVWCSYDGERTHIMLKRGENSVVLGTYSKLFAERVFNEVGNFIQEINGEPYKMPASDIEDGK